MEIRVFDQLRQLAAAIVVGGMTGLINDLFMNFSNCRKTAIIMRFFAALISVVLIFAVGSASGAGMRLFFLLAAAGGVCFYRWGLCPMVRRDLISIQQHLQYYTHFTHRNAAVKTKNIIKQGKK